MVYNISWESGRLPRQPDLGQKIALISSLQEIEKFIACTVKISGLVNFSTLSEFLRDPRELPWQPNLTKNKPKLHWFQFCAKNREIFRMKVRILGRRLQICYLNLQGNQGSCHGNQIQKNINQNCTNFCFLQKLRNFSHVQQGFMGFMNSNVLPEFSKELRKLPWQPNLGKNKPKLHKFQFLARNLEIFCM